MVCLDYVIRQKQLVLCLYFFYLILLCLQNSSFERWNSSKIFSMRLKKFAKIHHWILLSSSRSHFFRHAWSVQNRPCINVWKENVSLFLSNQAHCESIIIVAEYKNRNGFRWRHLAPRILFVGKPFLPQSPRFLWWLWI